MALRKVYGGTPVGSESRCDTCTSARIIQGYAESERIVFCDAMYPPTRIPFSVRECSMYEDKRLPEFEEMAKVAWEICTKNAGHTAGFVLLSDVANKQKDDLSQNEPQEVPAAASENK